MGSTELFNINLQIQISLHLTFLLQAAEVRVPLLGDVVQYILTFPCARDAQPSDLGKVYYLTIQESEVQPGSMWTCRAG